ncbi:MAG: hypothetical protein AAF511_00045 [Pseudomonadota bacterium]
MATLQIAHIREQQTDLIIVPLDVKFGYRKNRRQEDILFDIKQAARRAGLKGHVVPVWLDDDHKEMKFMAPEAWHPFFTSIDWPWMTKRLNKTLEIE